MLFLAADHAGFTLKEYLKAVLAKKKIAYTDLGAHTLSPNDDYPLYAKKIAQAVVTHKHSRGVAICGSGEGICIAANKTRGIRAALCWNRASAQASRTDDDANILCLAGQLLTKREALQILDAWLITPFSGFARHQRRIKQIE